ncbi:DUF1566 domain-containing protein [Vandammella animalimorsus]|uniref:Lcl C-terminal domain-containing protein n=1 Tax=Vandammella animalimorsus TaxID=2029117 RepID=UPI0015576F70|nr:DUF1566 domain-containing protein [Vandammella animalimorsus]
MPRPAAQPRLRWRTALAALALGAAALPALAACPSQPGRFVPNGAEVTDSQTGLVWARCSAGQSWDGSVCAGNAGRYTHEQALEYAASQSGWRLPSVKELFSLVDKGCASPAIDATVFPDTSIRWYWTATPFQRSGASAWLVEFSGGGHVGYYDRGFDAGAVRLVRASQ